MNGISLDRRFIANPGKGEDHPELPEMTQDREWGGGLEAIGARRPPVQGILAIGAGVRVCFMTNWTFVFAKLVVFAKKLLDMNAHMCDKEANDRRIDRAFTPVAADGEIRFSALTRFATSVVSAKSRRVPKRSCEDDLMGRQKSGVCFERPCFERQGNRQYDREIVRTGSSLGSH